jgi:hypothetical protein
MFVLELVGGASQYFSAVEQRMLLAAEQKVRNSLPRKEIPRKRAETGLLREILVSFC